LFLGSRFSEQMSMLLVLTRATPVCACLHAPGLWQLRTIARWQTHSVSGYTKFDVPIVNF
jgi:hypothetical protein